MRPVARGHTTQRPRDVSSRWWERARPLVSVREYRLRPYQVTFREFGDRTTSRGCARRQSTYTERVDRRGSRPGARGQHMGGGGWSRADPVAHKQTRARFFRSVRRRRVHVPPPHARGAPQSTRTSTGRLTLTPSQHCPAPRRGRTCPRACPRSSTRPCSGSPGAGTGSADDMYRPRRRGARAALRTAARPRRPYEGHGNRQSQNALRNQGGLGSELRLRSRLDTV